MFSGKYSETEACGSDRQTFGSVKLFSRTLSVWFGSYGKSFFEDVLTAGTTVLPEDAANAVSTNVFEF